jgi:hypothetical protein
MIRTAAALLIGLASAVFAFAAALAIGHAPLAAGFVALVVAAVVSWGIHRQRPFADDDGAASGSLKLAAAVVSIVALVLLVRTTMFMADPSKVSYSVIPSSQWEIGHSCLSAYYVAAETVGTGNVYDTTLYNSPDDTGIGQRKPKKLGPLNIDVFEYPPQFLLLARAFHFVTPDFFDLRLLWFAFCGAVLLIGLIVVADHIGGPVGTRALLFSPLLWIAIPTVLSTLQKGNIQIVIIAAAMIAMVLFARGRAAAGGAILGFAIVAKLWPGLMLVYLLVRGEWRAVFWTVAFATAFSGLTLALFGWAPYAAFLNHAPGLLSGEAFPAFRNPAPMAINLSIPNIFFKLRLFGIPGATFGVAKVLGWIYTIVAVGTTAWAARRPRQPDAQPLVWLAILIIASLRSPFLPLTYGAIPALWLLTLVAARRAPNARSLILAGAGFVALNATWPMDWPVDPRLLALASLVPLILSVALAIRVLRPAPDPDNPNAVHMPLGRSNSARAELGSRA